MNTPYKKRCLRCSHSWVSYLEHPKKCSRCRSKLYDAPIKNPEHSERMREWWKKRKSAPLV